MSTIYDHQAVHPGMRMGHFIDWIRDRADRRRARRADRLDAHIMTRLDDHILHDIGMPEYIGRKADPRFSYLRYAF